MPLFTSAEIDVHISKSGKSLDRQSKDHSVPTSMSKAKTVLDDEYLKDVLAASDEEHFYFKSLCHHSFRRNDPPHNLKIALDLVSGQVRNASCSCVAGQVGFCNHILALMMKICKFSLYACKVISELDRDEDMLSTETCTSTLQSWHRKGRGDKIHSQPVMEILVEKPKLDDGHAQSSKEPGVSCLLYEARNTFKTQQADEIRLKEQIKQINPAMALASILTPTTGDSQNVETRFGKCPRGSYASYQLSFTESNFQVFIDISSVARTNANEGTVASAQFPKFPIYDADEFQYLNHIL